MKSTDKHLMVIRRMLVKKKADVSLSMLNLSEGRYIATCKIVDDVGRSVSASVDSAQYNTKRKKGVSTEDFIGCVSIKNALEHYMELLTQETRNIIKENGLRLSSEVIDQMESLVKSTYEKSVIGENYITELSFGTIVELRVIISTNEKNLVDVSIQTKDGIVVFHDSVICTEKFDVNAFTQWLYAASENCLLANHCDI